MLYKSTLMLAAASVIGFTAFPQAASSQSSSAQQAYEEAVAYCRSGEPGIDVENCLRDAGAALQDAKRHGNGDANANFEENQRARCDGLSGTQHQDCLELLSSSDVETQGSVEGGGILRQRTITVPAD